MKRCNNKYRLILLLVTLFQAVAVSAQNDPTPIDLVQLAQQNGFWLENRTVQVLTDGNRSGVRLNEKSEANEGVAWLPHTDFSRGTIEVDIRGKDVVQRSFVGIAFHGSGERDYDAIYFRPFNFQATDPLRRIHAVQYISLPTYDWPILRKEFPDQYEKGVDPAPDPNGWFRARIVVDTEMIRVFVNDSEQPSLTVKKLSTRKEGSIGLWVGAASGGDFANLTITPK